MTFANHGVSSGSSMCGYSRTDPAFHHSLASRAKHQHSPIGTPSNSLLCSEGSAVARVTAPVLHWSLGLSCPTKFPNVSNQPWACATPTHKTSLNMSLRRTGALDPHAVIADVDLATHVAILEELHEREEWDGILFVVDPRGGHALRIDVVCERLVADLQRRSISRSTGTCRK